MASNSRFVPFILGAQSGLKPSVKMLCHAQSKINKLHRNQRPWEACTDVSDAASFVPNILELQWSLGSA